MNTVKNKINIYLLILTIFASFIISTNVVCAKTKKYVKSVSVSKKVSLNNDETVSVPLKIKVVNKASKKITYSIDDSSVAKVSFNSKKSIFTIKALKTGNANLTVKTKGKNKKGKRITKKLSIIVINDNTTEESTNTVKTYTFRKPQYLTEHFEKHGEEVGCKSEEEYLAAANAVINNPKALHKLEAEDNDHIYYIEDTNEIVFLSQDGYIRTYFICSGKAYFDRQ